MERRVQGINKSLVVFKHRGSWRIQNKREKSNKNRNRKQNVQCFSSRLWGNIRDIGYSYKSVATIEYV